MTTSVQQVKTTREERRPLFFGPASAQLYGCYHPPFGASRRSCAVVLCYPLGQEYMRSHRSFVQLAGRLAGKGFPVLRFDYFGCGDSAGATEEGRIDRWLADVGAAVDEVRRLSGAECVSLVGLRLGGALATLAAAARDDVDSLVLWDPVIRGADYCAELQALQAELLRLGYVSAPRPDGGGSMPNEVLGFRLPPELWAEIAAIDLLAGERPPASKVLLIESGAPAGLAQLGERLTRMEVHFEHRHLAEPKVWLAEPLQGLVPHHLLEAVVGWLTQVYR